MRLPEVVRKNVLLKGLMDQVQQFLVNHFSPLDQMVLTLSSDFEHLSFAAVSSLIASGDLSVDSEQSVFYAVQRWYDKSQGQQVDDFHNEGEALLESIRWLEMTPDYLYDVVWRSYMIDMMEFSNNIVNCIGYVNSNDARRQTILNTFKNRNPYLFTHRARKYTAARQCQYQFVRQFQNVNSNNLSSTSLKDRRNTNTKQDAKQRSNKIIYRTPTMLIQGYPFHLFMYAAPNYNYDVGNSSSSSSSSSSSKDTKKESVWLLLCLDVDELNIGHQPFSLRVDVTVGLQIASDNKLDFMCEKCVLSNEDDYVSWRFPDMDIFLKKYVTADQTLNFAITFPR